jgi:hypothetical protein
VFVDLSRNRVVGNMIHHEPEGVINHTDKMGVCPGYMLYIKHNSLRSIYWIIFPIPFKINLQRKVVLSKIPGNFLVCDRRSNNLYTTLRRNYSSLKFYLFRSSIITTAFGNNIFRVWSFWKSPNNTVLISLRKLWWCNKLSRTVLCSLYKRHFNRKWKESSLINPQTHL